MCKISASHLRRLSKNTPRYLPWWSESQVEVDESCTSPLCQEECWDPLAGQTLPVFLMFICSPRVVSQLSRLVTALVRRQALSRMLKPLKNNSMSSANIRTLTSTHDGNWQVSYVKCEEKRAKDTALWNPTTASWFELTGFLHERAVVSRLGTGLRTTLELYHKFRCQTTSQWELDVLLYQTPCSGLQRLNRLPFHSLSQAVSDAQ